MHKRTVVASIVILALIIVGMFVFAYLKNKELAVDVQSVPKVVQEKVGPYDYITRIDAKHFFIDGTHTIVGEIPFPTPCDLLNWDTVIAESFPEQVTVDFDVINNDTLCTEAITDQRFSVSFDASENAIISARLEGKSVELNLIPATEGETPDDFELFIKG